MRSATTKCFAMLAIPKVDAFVTWDAGAQKAGSEIKKTMNKLTTGQHDTLAIWTLFPKQGDLEKRASFVQLSLALAFRV